MPRINSRGDLREVQERLGRHSEMVHFGFPDAFPDPYPSGFQIGSWRARGIKVLTNVFVDERAPCVGQRRIRELIGESIGFLQGDKPLWPKSLVRQKDAGKT